MYNPCIAIDVSKGESHIAAYLGHGIKVGDVQRISHNKDGFKEISLLVEKLSLVSEKDPITIFESTGIYHYPLRTYLQNHNYRYSEVSPLLAAKHRKNSSLRSVKTDSRDTQALANLYYHLDPKDSLIKAELFNDLQELHRYYYSLTAHLVKVKVNFNEKMDVVFPNIRKDFYGNIYKKYYLELLKQLPHPDLILNKRVDALVNILCKFGIRKSRANDKAILLKEYCLNTYSGCSVGSVDSIIFSKHIDRILELTKEREDIADIMIRLGNKHPLYEPLQTIPGIGPILAIFLIAEMGDLSRFSNGKQLVAFAGLDPIVYQSGTYSGLGLHISKKGNKHLRRLLFQAVSTGVYVKQDHPIKSFFENKKSRITSKSAMVAASDKLLRTIFSMYVSGENYNFLVR